jgi:hypothetical protein
VLIDALARLVAALATFVIAFRRRRYPMVRVIGLEPILLWERTPEARASANSATPAFCHL